MALNFGKGSILTFDASTNSLQVFVGLDDLSNIRWSSGDNKRLAPFIKDREDFFALARIIADSHGLNIERMPEFFDGYAVKFI